MSTKVRSVMSDIFGNIPKVRLYEDECNDERKVIIDINDFIAKSKDLFSIDLYTKRGYKFTREYLNGWKSTNDIKYLVIKWNDQIPSVTTTNRHSIKFGISFSCKRNFLEGFAFLEEIDYTRESLERNL